MGEVVQVHCNLSNRWTSVVDFMPWLLYSQKRVLVPLKQKPGWARVLVWAFWRTEKIFCPKQDLIPRPSRWWNRCYTDQAISAPKFHPITGHEGPALAALHFRKKPYSHCTAPVWSGAVNLMPTTGFNPQTLQPIASHNTHYAG